MRIERITLQNLNSLAGEWTIDLSGEAYAENGIFAITGPTGAGKTTILDAVTLALYGETPRLSGFSQTDNQIMSRGTGIASAAVVFSTPAGRYKAEWEQRRARKKPDGALQAAKVRLQQETAPGEWTVLADQKRPFDAQVEKITGLNFAQFTRSVLLAQGNFSAFLKADVNTRADTLEKLTGTEIYAEISKAVYARSVEEKSKLEKAQTGLGTAQILADDVRAQRIDEQKALEREIKEQEERRAEAQEKRAQLKALEKARSELEAARKTLVDVQAKAPEIKDLDAELTQDTRASGIAEAGQNIATLRQNLKESETKIAGLKTAKASADTASVAAGKALEAAEQAASNAAAAWELLASQTLPAVRTLDKETRDKRKEKTEAETIQSTAQKALDAARAQETALLGQKQTNDAKLGAVRKWLETHEEDQGVKDDLPVLAGLAQGIASAETQAKATDKKLKGSIKKKDTAQARATKAGKELETQNQSVKEKRSEVEQTAGALSEALDGRTLAGLRTESEALSERRELLEKALEKVQRIALSRETLKDSEGKAAAARTALGAAEQELADAQKLKAAAKGEVKLLTDAIEKQGLIARLAEERRKLEEGEPCPLCGSLTHPFCLDLPPDDRTSLSAQREERQAEAESQGERIEEITRRIAASNAEIKSNDAEADRKRKEITREEAALKPLCESAGIEPEGGALREALGAAKTQLTALKKQIQKAETLESRKKALEVDLDKLKDGAAQAKETEAAAAAELKSAEEALDAGQSEADEAKQALATALAAFNDKAAPYGKAVANAKAAQALCETLKNKIAEREAKEQEFNEADKERTRLDGLIPAAQNAVVEKTKALGEARAKAAGLEAELKEIQAERTSLFGDRDPDAEEKKAQGQKATAEAQKKRAQETDANAKNALTAAKTSLEGEEKRQKELKTKLCADLPRWEQTLQDAGFGDESSWRAARLPPEARKTKEAAVRNHQKRLAEALASEKKALADVDGLEKAGVATLSEPKLEKVLSDADTTIKTASERQGQIQQELKHDAAERERAGKFKEKIEKLEKTTRLWDQMNHLIGSANGMNYSRFVQGLAFERLVFFANQALRKLTDRYLLDTGEALSLNVIDNWQAGAIRSSANLSGGESFIVSLALALGLSRMASRNARIESLFLDEGFGTLDDEALDTVLSALASLKSEGRLVGIISHVGQIEERIPVRIDIARKPGGVSIVSGPGVSNA